MIGKIKSFFKKNDGATAVEFSLLVMPFMLVVLGILEISLMFLSAAIVEGATDSASRIIRTGQLQKDGGDPETLFRDALCSFTGALVNCGDMAVEVVRMDSYFD
ncbi:MAG: TadE/TadG family type IV pilus assembly protein, partial [Alphaproteobacteria bacterium]